MFLHGGQKRFRTVDVVVVVCQRLLHGDADEREGCKVNDGFRVNCVKHAVQKDLVADVAAEKFGARVDRVAVPRLQIVDDGNLISLGKQFADAMAANVSGAAGDENHMKNLRFDPVCMKPGC